MQLASSNKGSIEEIGTANLTIRRLNVGGLISPTCEPVNYWRPLGTGLLNDPRLGKSRRLGRRPSEPCPASRDLLHGLAVVALSSSAFLGIFSKGGVSGGEMARW